MSESANLRVEREREKPRPGPAGEAPAPVTDRLIEGPFLCAGCGAAAPDSERPCTSCGGRIAVDGRYLVTRKLGPEESRHAWEAHDTRRGVRVTLKVLRYAEVSEPRSIELFERQFAILKHLSHPRVPRAHELLHIDWMGEHALVIVLDHVPGESLEMLLEQGLRLDEGGARALLSGMLDILAHLHSRSPAVVHRDIKPPNIVVQPDGTPALVDFDTAREVSSELDVGFETFVATAGYVPPEQVAGRSQPASDLYALGATLVRALSRRHPTELPVEAMRLRFEPYVNVSAGFAAVLRRLLEPDIEARFHSVEEVRSALAAGEVAPAVRHESRGLFQRPLLRAATFLATIAVAVAVLLGRPTPKGIPGFPGHQSARDLVAMGPAAIGSASARRWNPTREELERCDIRWAARVLDASTPQRADLAIGPPDVYGVPNLGLNEGWMKRGWTPATGEQWLTLSFAPDAAGKHPRPTAILIVEINASGAVARVDDMTDAAKPVALWNGRLADSERGTRILRIDLARPRRIEKLRVFLEVPRFASNPIDAVGLLVAEPESPVGGSGATAEAREWKPPPGAIAPEGVVWARAVLGRSLDQPDWGAPQILGAPDVFPKHDHTDKAWIPHHSYGRRWIALSFGSRTQSATGIVVYESNHPGAVVRVDDLSGREGRAQDLTDPLVLWEGHVPVPAKAGKPLPFPCWSDRSRVLRIDLEEPRAISALRLVLDTSKGCYSEIDAVGLVAPSG